MAGRLRDAAAEQLTFDIFAADAELAIAPELSSFAVSGGIVTTTYQSLAEDEVVVQLIDKATGALIAKAAGYVSSIGFQTHRKKGERPWIERKHRIKIGELTTDAE